MRLLSRSDRGDHLREAYAMTTAREVVMPAFRLRPSHARIASTADQRLPLVVACNGHGFGAREIVGLGVDGKERDIPMGYQQDFIVQLCRRGFLMAVPELTGFGGPA